MSHFIIRIRNFRGDHGESDWTGSGAHRPAIGTVGGVVPQ